MSENQQNWISWARHLHQWGIKEGVASVLEVAGSLNVLLAQLLYISQPLVSGIIQSSSLRAVAHTLENPEDRQEFIAFLREVPTVGPST
jgi:hypothetical protein